MKYQLITFLFFLISFQQVSAQCDECPQPVIEEVDVLGGGLYDIYWSIDNNECARRLCLRGKRTSCGVGSGGFLGCYTLSTAPNPIRATDPGGSSGNAEGNMLISLWAECSQIICPNTCAISDTSKQNIVLSTCDCELFSVDYDCDQICYNIEAHDFNCVAYDVTLYDQTDTILSEFTVASNGESVQYCVDRNPLNTYATNARVDVDCNPLTGNLTIVCGLIIIPSCDEPTDPCEEGAGPNVTIECNPETGSACVKVDGVWYYNDNDPSYQNCSEEGVCITGRAGETVTYTFCEWGSNCGTGEGCCWTYDLVVPECSEGCPDFPKDLEYDCSLEESAFVLEVEGFLVCPRRQPLSAAGNVVEVVLCSWQAGDVDGGPLTDCDTGRCCKNYKIRLPETCCSNGPSMVALECPKDDGLYCVIIDGVGVGNPIGQAFEVYGPNSNGQEGKCFVRPPGAETITVTICDIGSGLGSGDTEAQCCWDYTLSFDSCCPEAPRLGFTECKDGEVCLTINGIPAQKNKEFNIGGTDVCFNTSTNGGEDLVIKVVSTNNTNCCWNIPITVPEFCCVPDADCTIFTDSIIGYMTPQLWTGPTYISGVTATIGVDFFGGGIHDHLIITVNGTPVIDQIVGVGGFSTNGNCPDGTGTLQSSFCVNPCDIVAITVNTALCYTGTDPTYWRLDLTCNDGCNPGIDQDAPVTSRSNENNINENQIAEELLITPNPTSDFISLNVTDGFIGEYQIIDLSGRLIKTGKYDSSVKKISTNDIESGTYILRLTSATNGQNLIAKFVRTDTSNE